MAEKLSIWFTVTYIPGKENLDPVGKSHKKEKDLEWILNRYISRRILQHFLFDPSVPSFASRLNNQLPHYVAYHQIQVVQAL